MRSIRKNLTKVLPALVCVALMWAVAGANAADQIPTWKSAIFPSYMPKHGQADTGERGGWMPGGTDAGNKPGNLRDIFGTFYEQWWREYSYYQTNPTNGAPIRGWWMATKTYGESALPWTMGIAGGVTTNVNAILQQAYQGIVTYRGFLVPVPSRTMGVSFTIGGAVVSDPLGTGALTGDGSGTVDYDTGEYVFTLNAPPQAPVDITTTYLAEQIQNMTSPADWVVYTPDIPKRQRGAPDGRGQRNWEVPPKPGIPPQLYGGTGPLLDGYWTPGERFTDTSRQGNRPNGQWDDAVPNEDRWGNDNNPPRPGTNGFLIIDEAQLLTKTAGPWDKFRGEYFAAYGFQDCVKEVNGRVTAVYLASGDPSHTNHTIYVASTRGTNTYVSIADMDLSPPGNADDPATNNYPVYEGDFFHTAVTGHPGTAIDIPMNRKFDYNVSYRTGLPLVYPAYGNGGDSGLDTNRIYITFYSYLRTPQIMTPIAQRPDYCKEAAHYDGSQIYALVYVPVYQAGELWGIPYQSNTIVNTYIDAPDANGYTYRDNVWTRGAEAEPFEDYIAWWSPFLGLPVGRYRPPGSWVTGIVGLPGNHAGNQTDPYTTISLATYRKYINDNYPGDTVSLNARAGNNRYDGPDNWEDLGEEANNHMQWGGYDTQLALFGPGWEWFNMGYGTSLSALWTYLFSSYSGGVTPGWAGMPAHVMQWTPVAASNNSTVVTNFVGTSAVVATNWSDVTYPPTGSTWGYNSPREFKDMASSMYHVHGDIRARVGRSFGQGGDMRLGEITSPWNTEIWGQDKGTHIGPPKPYDLPAPALKPNDIIPTRGPWSYRQHGVWGADAGDVMDLELLTWRIDGTGTSGPKSVHRAVANASPMYGGDHRDVDLDGLVDQGETIPHNAVNYMVDPDPNTTDDGMATMYPFHWQRFLEDVMQLWDDVEDFPELYRRTSSGTDERIVAPGGYTWPDGVVMSSPSYFNTGGRFVCYKQEAPPHTGFEPNTDDVWIEVDGNNTYNADNLITNISGLVSNGFAGTSIGGSILYYDADGSGFYEPGENVWLDNSANGTFDSDLVLSDQYYLLKPGLVGTSITAGPTNTINLYYQDVNANGAPDALDNFWIENRFVPTTRTNVYDVTGTSQVDIAIYAGTPGLLTNGVVATGIVPNAFYIHRDGSQPDTGWLPDDDVWVEKIAPNGTFNCTDQPIAAPRGLARFAPGAGSLFPDAVAYNDVNGSFAYEYGYDDVWFDYDANGRFDVETVVLRHGTLVNGDVGTRITAPVAWIDIAGEDGNLNGIFDPVNVVSGGEGAPEYGDALFIDGNTNTTYDVALQRGIGVYWVGLYNGAGASAPAVFKAGNVFGCASRDGMNVGGYMQVQPILRLGTLTHEQCHDVLGWPDLYDYDRYGGTGVYNMPIGATDLMADGFLVHGFPSLKPVWMQNLKTIIGTPNSGIRTVKMYPIEHVPDQYFAFSASGRSESFVFHYQSGDSIYSSPLSRGLQISHTDGGSAYGFPIPVQRSNMRFSRGNVIQADGLYEMEDGVNGGTAADAWPGPLNKRVFSENTVPPARWWDQLTSGIRIVDIREPVGVWDPIEVDFEWIATSGEWFWTAGGSDMDGDAIPDDWELHWFSKYWESANDTTNHVDQTTDWDGDGLPDYAEYLARLNPTKAVSWTMDPYNSDPRNDSQYDLDGDLLSNIQEYNLGMNMREPDSDDDGISDRDELDPTVLKADGKRFTDPLNSRDPLIQRSLVMNSNAGFPLPNGRNLTGEDRFANSNWSVEAWVNLSATDQTGILVGRETTPGVTNYALGVVGNVPAVYFSSQGYKVMAGGVTNVHPRLPTNQWFHLAASWDAGTHGLRLFVNGTNVQTVTSFVDPVYWVQSPNFPSGGFIGFTTFINRGLVGYMDDARVWKSARTEAQIRDNRSKMVDETSGATNAGHYVLSGIGSGFAPIRNNPDLVAYYMFDDSWNSTIVNKLTSLIMSYGTEDLHRPLEWDYAIRNQPVVLATNTYANIKGREVYFIPGGGRDSFLDSDHDGLDDAYEYLAGTDANHWDSWSTGNLDYDKYPRTSWSNSDDCVTFGQKYDDMDMIPDSWEILYMGNCPTTGKKGLDPATYDADKDPDEDGWTNYAERMGRMGTNVVVVQGTDPLDGTNSYPTPLVNVTVKYSGKLSAAFLTTPVHIDFFTSPAMDGTPVATLNVTGGFMSTRIMDNGHLREGRQYAFAYLDENGNDEWDGVSEPAGLSEYPINVGWDEVNDLQIALSDIQAGYPVFWWTPVPGAGAGTQYLVKVLRGSATLFQRVITARNYMHIGDYLNDNRYGLGIDAANAYSWMVYTNMNTVGIENWVPYAAIPVQSVMYTNETTTTPTVLTPQDQTFAYARNKVQWTMDNKASSFRIDVANMAGTVLATVTNYVPYRDGTGNYEYYMPFYAGDNLTVAAGNTWTNGRYQVRVSACTPTRTLTSGWRAFNLNLTAPESGGKSAISGNVYYNGKARHGFGVLATNMVIMVQVFNSVGFSGIPVAQVQIPPSGITEINGRIVATYDVLGLPSGKYYVKAFLEQNGNRQLDTWEAWGFSNDILLDSAPNTVDLSDSTPVRAAGIGVMLRDRDTDNDRLPDAWEYQYYGNLDKGTYDLGVNGLTLIRNFQIGGAGGGISLSPLVNDNDGDTLSDMFEITYSHTNDYSRFNPYNAAYNPTGTDLNPFSADSNGDGTNDAASIAGGIN
ncbi:MAG: hypothetical protein C0404_00225, partial [Verrucomicrobia bacterium]|nr:hypothetical protein [Verrucomicrobiota bacterium]